MKLILMMKATFILSFCLRRKHAGVYSQQVRLSMTWEVVNHKLLMRLRKILNSVSCIAMRILLE